MNGDGRLAHAVTAVAAHGLVGSCVPAPERPFAGRDWDRFLMAVTTEGLPGHLAAAISSGAFPATSDQAGEAVELHVRALSHALRLERLLLRAASCLQRAGIDHRVLKGAALAHIAYSDPSLRVYGDVDLLVPSDAAERAVAALASRGFSPAARRRWPGFGSRSTGGVAMGWADGLEVDIRDERELFGGSVVPDRLFEDGSEFTLGGGTLRTLAPEQMLLHVCYEAAPGNGARVGALRDVAELVLRAGMDADRVLAAASCSPWGAAAVARAIRSAWERFALGDIVPLSVWASRYEPDSDERRALAELRRTRDRARAPDLVRAVREVMLRVPFLPPWGDRLGPTSIDSPTGGTRR